MTGGATRRLFQAPQDLQRIRITLPGDRFDSARIFWQPSQRHSVRVTLGCLALGGDRNFRSIRKDLRHHGSWIKGENWQFRGFKSTRTIYCRTLSASPTGRSDPSNLTHNDILRQNPRARWAAPVFDRSHFGLGLSRSASILSTH